MPITNGLHMLKMCFTALTLMVFMSIHPIFHGQANSSIAVGGRSTK